MFVFHSGRTEANSQGIIQGHTNTPLNSTGIEQARALSTTFPVREYELIYSSDLARAYMTAEEIVRQGEPPHQTIHSDERLRERTLGSLDGKHGSLFANECKLANLNPDDHTPKGAESLKDLQKRLYDFIENRLLPESASAQKILLVSHGVTIREMIKYLLDYCQQPHQSYDIDPRDAIPPNTSVSVFKVHLDKERKISDVSVLCLHDISHLKDDMQQQALSHHKFW